MHDDLPALDLRLRGDENTRGRTRQELLKELSAAYNRKKMEERGKIICQRCSQIVININYIVFLRVA